MGKIESGPEPIVAGRRNEYSDHALRILHPGESLGFRREEGSCRKAPMRGCLRQGRVASTTGLTWKERPMPSSAPARRAAVQAAVARSPPHHDRAAVGAGRRVGLRDGGSIVIL